MGLALQSSFGLLFFLKIVQSAGISGSYIVTYGVLGDLFTPSERGGYSGVVSFSLNTPPSVGPVISGLLMSRWGWRSIFWFPAAISPCCLLAIILFLPETSRHVVGDGCIETQRVNRVLFSFLSPSKLTVERQMPTPKARSCQIPKPWAFLAALSRPGTAIVIGSFGVYYTLYTCLSTSVPINLICPNISHFRLSFRIDIPPLRHRLRNQCVCCWYDRATLYFRS